jgi:hypothetical protein
MSAVCTADVHDKRLAFAVDYSAVYDPARVVSIDESSFYFDMKPAHGYCHRSRRLRVPSRPGGRTRWSLLMAVSNERVVGWRLEKGSINGAIFADFMSTLDTDDRDVVLMDNASIHKTSLVMDTIIGRGLTPCFLPPYTPDFQPIEHCFSVLKNRRLPATAADVHPYRRRRPAPRGSVAGADDAEFSRVLRRVLASRSRPACQHRGGATTGNRGIKDS